jgi:hypothetical protein
VVWCFFFQSPLPQLERTCFKLSSLRRNKSRRF